MTTRERIEADYIREFKARNTAAIDALRMLRAAIKSVEIDTRTTLDEAGIVDVVGKEMKKLKDALEQFASRADLADKTKAEMELLQVYLPAQLSDEDLRAVVAKVVAAAGEVSAKDFGKVMAEVMKEAKGKADGGKVSSAVKDALSGK
jgi:hypothetical protein